MRTLLSVILSLLLVTSARAADQSTTECIGPTQPKGYVIYLHGFIPPDQKTNEEGENLEVLERLAKDLSLRIALPRGPLCPGGKLCWPAGDKDELLKTFVALRERSQTCWTGQPEYTLLGFSNGGYFALKLYKAHEDPRLTRIIAAGSAGTWDGKMDRAHPSSSFAMMIGQQDITLKKATQLAHILRKIIPGFRFEKFPGAHRLDYKTLTHLLQSRNS
jgi:pimeloyl-ACP methyl ester carboxylesterase